MLKSILVGIGSVTFGVVTTILLGTIADRRGWRYVNGWAMMHHTGPLVFLVLALVGFHVVSTIGARVGYLQPSWPPGRLAHAAYLTGAVGTLADVGGILSVPGYVGFYLDYILVGLGLIVGIAACILRMRGGNVRQFGLVLASLLVNGLSALQSIRMEWSMWQIRHHVG